MTEIKSFAHLWNKTRKEMNERKALERMEHIERKKLIQDMRVVGGVHRYEPIDKQSAMLLAKAPWYNKPPSITERKENDTEKNTIQRSGIKAEMLSNGKKLQSKKRVKQCVLLHAPENAPWRFQEMSKQSPLYKGVSYDPEFIDGKESINIEELSGSMAVALEQNIPKELSPLAKKAQDSRQVLEDSVKGIGLIVDEFDRLTESLSGSIRSKRMAIVSECASVTNALKDIRQFFLGPDYEKEQKRLSEFVELCERLQKLKESGFLDTVADTMIRLAAYDK